MTTNNSENQNSNPSLNDANAAAGLLSDNSIVVNAPDEEQRFVRIITEPGKTYIFEFGQNKVESMDINNGDLNITFENGAQLTFLGYEQVQNGGSSATFMLGEPVSIEDTIRANDNSNGGAQTTEDLRIRSNTPQGEVTETEIFLDENITTAEEDAAMTALAEGLAEIEPAAGENGQGGDDDDDGGSAFQSNFTAEPVVPLTDIGPIGPTSLQFASNFAQPELLFFDPDAPQLDPSNMIPEFEDSGIIVDESNIVPNGRSDSGVIDLEFGSDAPGTVTPVPVGGFDAAGSLLNNSLTSGGVPILVNVVGDTFVGTANGVTVFELEVPLNGNGAYTFTQFEPLDHEDGTDDNDVIDLLFDVILEDADGDQVEASITVSVRDDAPVAQDDTAGTDNATPITGNVLNNDDTGEDQPGSVQSVTFNGVTTLIPSTGTANILGDFGTLTIGQNGNFTYTPNGTPDGVDQFTYVLQDFDGDSDEGLLTITVDTNSVPQITPPALQTLDESNLPTGVNASGTIAVDFGVDAPGTITPNDPVNNNGFNAAGSLLNGNFTSNGFAITVTLNGDTFTGRSQDGRDIFTMQIQSDGTFNFTQLDQIDHNDGNNDNDIITLNFNFAATDADGDTATDTVSIAIQDDAPVAVNDNLGSVDLGDTRTGNVLGNDDAGEDIPPTVTQIAFNGQTFAISPGVQTTVQGNFGILRISTNGDFEYTAQGDGEDIFTYTLRDFDGDTDTANIIVRSTPDAPVFIVGNNGDDDAASNDPHVVGGSAGEINGGSGSDILVGDVGGSTLVPQNEDFDIVMVLDTSGSMGSNTESNSRISLLIDAVKNLMAEFDAYQNGQIKVHFVEFATNVKSTFTVDFANANALVDANNFLNSLDGAGLTNYESPLQTALSYLNSNEPLGNGATVQTFFVSDGSPNRYVEADGSIANPPGSTAEEDSIVLAEITGTSVTTSDGTFGDNTDEVGQLQAFGSVIGVGINIDANRLANLDAVDSTGQAINVLDPQDLNSTFQTLNPIIALDNVGDDTLNGDAGDDFIFGDVLFTDALADAEGLNTSDGSGFEVFERLENGEGLTANWSRATTIQYIRDNAEEMGGETLNAQNQARNGGNDTIDGGAGDDIIFGQEGDDDITGGEGNDTLFGGSGSDRFIFGSVNEGVDTIKDFDATEDLLDISVFLTDFDPLQDSINDFVFGTETGGNTTIAVDVNGTGDINNAFNLAILEGATGLDLEAITNNGQATV